MRRRTAFTLVELLAVIGIIAVLIAILLPALQKAHRQAQQVACASNMRQVAFAALAYAEQNGGHLPVPLGTMPQLPSPPDVVALDAVPLRGFGVYDYDHGTIWPYVGSRSVRERVFNCPADPDPRPVVNPIGTVLGNRNFSFNFNWYLAAGRTHARGLKLNQILHPDYKVLVEELEHPSGPAEDVSSIGTAPDGSWILICSLTRRHSGLCNEAMADGHVEALDPTQFTIPDPNQVGFMAGNAMTGYYFGMTGP